MYALSKPAIEDRNECTVGVTKLATMKLISSPNCQKDENVLYAYINNVHLDSLNIT